MYEIDRGVGFQHIAPRAFAGMRLARDEQHAQILADALYGAAPCDVELAAGAAAIGRQALHAAVLSFVHPTSGERLRFEAPLPADMAVALDALRALPAKTPR